MESLLRLYRNRFDGNLREVISGSAVGLGIKILSAVSLFAMNIIVARTLGPIEAGLFFLGFTFVTIAAAVGRLGLDQSLVRFIAAEKASGTNARLHGVYRKAVIWVTLASIITMLLSWTGLDWLSNQVFDQPGFADVLAIAIFAIPLMALYVIQAQALQGLKKVAKSMMVLNVLTPLFILALIVVFPVSTAVELSRYFLVACVFTLLVGIYFWFRSSPCRQVIEPFSAHTLRSACIPLWGVAILAQVTQWSSQFMLGTWSTAEDVAFFATAQRTAMLTSFILFAVNSIAAPKFSAMFASGDMDALKRLSNMTVRLMLVAAVPALVFILAFPQWLMGFFGDEFRQAAPALVILAMGQFVNIATGSVGYLLSMTGHEKDVRTNVLLSALIGIALGVILIPGYGLIGASIATAVAIASQNLLGVYQVKKRLGFNTLVFWQ